MTQPILHAVKLGFAVSMASAALLSAFAAFDFQPRETASAYDWATRDWKEGGVYSDRLPADTDEAWIVARSVRESDSGMFVSSGTDAKAKKLYLGNVSTLDRPMKLTVDGGSLLAGDRAYIGHKSPAVLTVQNGGTFTSGGQYFYLGFANTDASGGKITVFDVKTVVADETSRLDICGTDTYMGSQTGGLSLLENHGTVNFASAAQSFLLMGYSNSARTPGSIVSVVDNYGTITASDVFRYYVGGTSGQTGVITNHVAALIDKAQLLSIGSGSNSVGRLVNEGTIKVRNLCAGGNTWTASARNTDTNAIAVGWIENSGVIDAGGWVSIGAQTNCVGYVENTGAITGATDCVLGHYPGSKGCFRHAAGEFSFTNSACSVVVGRQGGGTLEFAGDTATVFDGAKLVLANNDGDGSGTFHASGELVVTNSASVSLAGRNLDAAAVNHASARIALYDSAKLENAGTLTLGNVRSDSVFELHGSSVVTNVNVLVLNAGSSSPEVSGTTTMKLSGAAKVCGLGNVYIGSNVYNKVELEVADNALFGLRDNATSANIIRLAPFQGKHGDATLRLRGGKISLGTGGSLQLGDTSDEGVAGCPARLTGYGSVVNQGSSGIWSRLDMRAGSVTADGEGEMRDLDMSTFARLSGTVSEGRTNLNLSGTNGWYAVNKGRLAYPRRDNDAGVRFVGDYARLSSSTNPKYVNSMRILVKDGSGAEVTGSRRYKVEMYASDRDDIPAGLVEDASHSCRLGVWRGNCSLTSFAKADVTIRYDHWLLSKLKNKQGNIPSETRICLYRHDGTSGGSWKLVSSTSLGEAEANGHLIRGEFAKSSDSSYNLGWFAAAAKCPNGTVIIVW